jgi:lipopolysaccharide biosynthesis glycosyltransferase
VSLKWYFAISEASLARPDHDWRALIRAAVESARQNTTLRAHMLYDGELNEFTEELEQKGVRIIPHRVSFYADLEKHGRSQWDWYVQAASGAFLRTEIPLIETEEDLVLYTDCDVMFLSEFPALSCREPFAVAPESEPDAHSSDLNTGVMLMNLSLLRESLPEFRLFIRQNLEKLVVLDQTAYGLFYAGQFNALKPELNWRPYWGFNNGAVIIHWHGPKPTVVRRFLHDPDVELSYAPWAKLCARDPDSYRRYLTLWDAFSAAYYRRPGLNSLGR